MAKQKLNLHAYQQEILDKLRDSAQSGQTAPSTRLAVKVDKSDFLFGLGDVREVLAVPEILHIPLTQPWFLGMANVRGNLYALSDLSLFLGGQATPLTSQSRILLLHERFGINSALLVNQLVGLRSVDEMQIQKKTKADSKLPWVLNKYKDPTGQKWDEIDVAKLIDQHEFMQVAA